MIKSLKYIALSLGTLAAASCSDFLDKIPDERTDITIRSEKDEENVIMLLNSAYPEYNFSWIAELSSDNLIDNQCPHLPSSPNAKQVLTHYNYGTDAKFEDELFRFDPANTASTNDWESPGAVWQAFFGSIASCNYAINAIDDWEQRNGSISVRLKAARAEAKLLRSYDHFLLANLFCQPFKTWEASKSDIGLPYVVQPEDHLIMKYDRGNVSDLYQNIQKDLEEGLADISNINFKAPKYHFNQDAAHAYAARYYLFTRQYDKVIEHANYVLKTNDEDTKRMLPNYCEFDSCARTTDFAKVWQSPNNNNNIMLTNTYSILYNKVFGTRYSLAGKNSEGSAMVRTDGQLWKGLICPVQSAVGALLLSSSYQDYGFISSKILGEFEVKDKIAQTGYPHVIQRTFTSTELLLERAEAHIMLNNLDAAANDLMLYWNSSFDSFSENQKKEWEKNFIRLTKEKILSYYGKKKKMVEKDNSLGTGDDEPEYIITVDKPNCFNDWNIYTHEIDPAFTISEEQMPFMNCLNDFRRYETNYEGLRFFDIKRWNLPVKHEVGLSSTVYEFKPELRALEVPWETISSGLETSRPQKSKEEAQSNSAIRSITTSRSQYIYHPAED